MTSSFNPVVFPYNWSSNVSDPLHRNAFPGSDVLGNGKTQNNQNMGLAPGLYFPPTLDDIGVQNEANVTKLDSFFFNSQTFPNGSPQYTTHEFAPPSLQETRPREAYANMFIQKAAKSLNVKADPEMAVFFSDSNIEHLLTVVVQKVKDITAQSGVAGNNEGVSIMKPNIQDFFNYMLYFYQNYKVYNGSICFVNLRNNNTIQDSVGKLNTSVLQEYISKMVSQINMYIYYYIDASTLPEQLSVPVMTSMKGSRTLEYNTGFYSGNSIGASSYNQVGNIN